jgi:hypothetical protein
MTEGIGVALPFALLLALWHPHKPSEHPEVFLPAPYGHRYCYAQLMFFANFDTKKLFLTVIIHFYTTTTSKVPFILVEALKQHAYK